MLCLQLMLPKKNIQESKIRGGKLFRLDNCQRKGCRCLYVCVKEKVSKMHLPLIVVFSETDICPSSSVFLYPITLLSICFSSQDYSYLLTWL